MIERLFERLLTSWLFWGMMVAIALWLAIVEAFFPRALAARGCHDRASFLVHPLVPGELPQQNQDYFCSPGRLPAALPATAALLSGLNSGTW